MKVSIFIDPCTFMKLKGQVDDEGAIIVKLNYTKSNPCDDRCTEYKTRGCKSFTHCTDTAIGACRLFKKELTNEKPPEDENNYCFSYKKECSK